MRRELISFGASLFLLFLCSSGASAFDLNLHGSMTENGPKHYSPPVSNPLFNETPYITTELRPIYVYHDIHDSFLTGGGKIQVVGMEARVALNERLGIIASKDGYFNFDFDGVLQDEDGFANISIGVKYALVNNPEENRIVTVGLEYEPPSGNLITGIPGVPTKFRMQGTADGFLDMFVSAAETWGKLGLEGNVGLNLAIDPEANSSMIHLSAHADYEIIPDLFPLVEVNMFSIVDDGSRNPFNFEGLDIVNFGSGFSSGSTGPGTVATLAMGTRYKIMDHLIFGAAYELPISDRKDLFGWRMTTDLVIYY